MGIYDRSYYQEESGYGFRPGGGSIVTKLIIINVLIFVADLFTPAFEVRGDTHHWLSEFLSLKSDVFTKPWNAWQLLTAGFAHAPMDSQRSIMHIFANMLSLFVFGRALEEKYGSKEFLRLYLVAIVLSNLVWAIFQAASGIPGSVKGASGGVAAIVVVFVLNFPHQKLYIIPFPFAVPAWIIGLLLVGGDLLGALGGAHGSNVAYIAHLAGAAIGLLYHQSRIRLEEYLPSGNWFTNWKLPKLRRPRLKIHQPPRSPDLDRRADAILEKVHRYGADSISDEERKILDEYSRRMRQKLR